MDKYFLLNIILAKKQSVQKNKTTKNIVQNKSKNFFYKTQKDDVIWMNIL